jgi:hypothetical protein
VALLERATGTGLAGLIMAGAIADGLGLRLASRPVAIGVIVVVAGAGALVPWATRRADARRGRRGPGATTTETTPESLPSSIAPALP